MGATAIALIYSPWGKQSGAHMNPAMTLTFTRLGKVAPGDAAGLCGRAVRGRHRRRARRRHGRWAACWPIRACALCRHGAGPVGRAGGVPGGGRHLLSADDGDACGLEPSRWAACTGVCAGLLVASYITFEAPLSGMSMNPARTFGSALFARNWTALWIYFTAPPLGMLRGGRAVPGAPGAADGGLLRQAASPEREALHLLRVPGRTARDGAPQGTNPRAATL